MYNVKLATKILNDITEKSKNMDYRSITFAKTKLSHSDVDILKDILNYIISTGGTQSIERRFYTTMQGSNVKNVLENKKIICN